MPEFIDIRRVTVTVETALEEKLLKEFKRLGARGYTCIYCTGKGRHEVMEDPYTGHSLVQIQVLARASVAEAIMQYVHGAGLSNYPAIAVMDNVTVYAEDTFF